MYFDEDLLLKIRLETLHKYVDQFIIVEANLDHAGNEKKPQFDILKFSKYKNKIKYFFIEDLPKHNNFYKKNGVLLGEEKIYKEMHFQKAMKIVTQMI